MAEVSYRSWPPALAITSVDGEPVVPTSCVIQLRIAQQRLAAASPGERPAAQERMEFLGAHLSELVVALRCRRGHETVQTVPGLFAALRRTPGSWVTPR
jgi:hypothetical protein